MKIPESSEPCYVVTMEFLQLLPTPSGKTWVVATHVDHNVRATDMIFQINADSFKTTTDGTSIPYAHSIERTLWWVNNFASRFKPQELTIGKSWGVIASDSDSPTELMIEQVDAVQIGNQIYHTYKLGYLLAQESIVQISDEFPFPLQAIVYKPLSSHQNAPLEFTVDLISHSSSNLCHIAIFDQYSQSPKVDVLSENISSEMSNTTADYDELMGDDSNDWFETISTENEIAEIENHVNHTNDIEISAEIESIRQALLKPEFLQDFANNTLELSNMDHKMIKKILVNFTGFLQLLTDAANNMTKTN
jgi:hypothetical protein